MNDYKEIEELSYDELNNLTGFIKEILGDAQKRATEEINAYLRHIRNHNKELFTLFFDNDLDIDNCKVSLIYVSEYGVESSHVAKELRNKLAKKYATQTVRLILEEQRELKQNKK